MSPASPTDPWWSESVAILIGIIGGAGGGTLCGLLGAAAGILVPRGLAKPVLVPLFSAMLALGIVALIAGIVAVAASQPYHVFYPLLLGGGIVTLVTGGLLPVLLAGYRRAEARRMHAQDLRRA